MVVEEDLVAAAEVDLVVVDLAAVDMEVVVEEVDFLLEVMVVEVAGAVELMDAKLSPGCLDLHSDC